MHKSMVLIALIFFGFLCDAQQIKPGKFSRYILADDLNCIYKDDIFKDLGWTWPDVKSKEISLSGGNYSFLYKNSTYTISKISDTAVSISARDGIVFESHKQQSNNDIYYDIHKLPLKPVTFNSGKKEEEYAIRDFYNGKLQTVTPFQLEIPVYSFYNLELSDKTHFLLYETKDGKYFLQNINYMIAYQKGKLSIVFIDQDFNGCYTDFADDVKFFSTRIKYKVLNDISENVWYSQRYLKDNYFMFFRQDGGNLTIRNDNESYQNFKFKGRIMFRNLPADARVIINRKEYLSINNKVKGFKCKSGFYHVRIIRTGHLDFESTFLVDDTHPEQIIEYKSQSSDVLEIHNEFNNKYKVTISAGEDYNKVYYNEEIMNIPPGTISFEIDSEGYIFRKTMKLKAGDVVKFNF